MRLTAMVVGAMIAGAAKCPPGSSPLGQETVIQASQATILADLPNVFPDVLLNAIPPPWIIPNNEIAVNSNPNEVKPPQKQVKNAPPLPMSESSHSLYV